ncbi:MAG: MFS transporter [Clostridia bacterium]|nr:MFS transporter [Clostridia bacterium]
MTNQVKIDKEIAKRQKQLGKSGAKYYFFYLFFIISIIYITDEVASALGTFMKTEIANDLMAKYGEASVGKLNIITVLSFPIMALGVLYKPLADRFGRKPFLVLNTFGMCLGLLVIYLTKSLTGYIIGSVLTQFFITHDMQVVYIMESAPPKHRAKIYSSIKCIAMLGVLFIPMLRKFLLENTSQWRRVYLAPALIGMAVSFVAIFLARETDAFNSERIKTLKGQSNEKSDTENGGIIKALRYGFKHKQIRWLFLALVFSETGYILTNDYQAIMTYGFANTALNNGLFDTLKQAAESVGVNEVTTALFFYPIGCAISQLIPGFISDKKGRRVSAIAMSASALVLFLCFWLGAEHGMAPQLVGFLCGGSVGTFWANIDTISLMAGESTPTGIRSSMLSAIYLPLGIGIGVSFGISLPLESILGNSKIGIIAFALAIPGLLADFLILTSRVKETNGIDLKNVDGTEFE